MGCFWHLCGFLYVMSLRGSEGLLLDLKRLNEFNSNECYEYLVEVLYGKLKREDHDQRHLLPVVRTTGSGISLEM
jgi:hypothetical protein